MARDKDFVVIHQASDDSDDADDYGASHGKKGKEKASQKRKQGKRKSKANEVCWRTAYLPSLSSNSMSADLASIRLGGLLHSFLGYGTRR